MLEHTHRLAATVVGTLTIVLAVWLGRSEPRQWVRKLSYVALVLVVVQGFLGGMRVNYRAAWIGIFHGCTAQAFLALVSVIALVTSRWWLTLGKSAVRRLDKAGLARLGKL